MAMIPKEGEPSGGRVLFWRLRIAFQSGAEVFSMHKRLERV